MVDTHSYTNMVVVDEDEDREPLMVVPHKDGTSFEGKTPVVFLRTRFHVTTVSKVHPTGIVGKMTTICHVSSLRDTFDGEFPVCYSFLLPTYDFVRDHRLLHRSRGHRDHHRLRILNLMPM